MPRELAGPASAALAAESDEFPISAIDHVELYVANTRHAAWAYERLGFTEVAYAGLETGRRDRASRVLRQGDVRLVLTAGLDQDSPVVEHVRRHGEGVATVAFTVPDATVAFDRAVAAGATPLREPAVLTGDDGEVVVSAIGAYGAVAHSFVSRDDFHGSFLPGFDEVPTRPVLEAGITDIDHLVAAMPQGRTDELIAFYRDVLGFTMLVGFDDTRITTEHSALMNKVMAGGHGRIKLPIVEPGRGDKRSQVQEFLDYHDGPGVQHIALATGDIVASVEELGTRGVEFLGTPGAYYDTLPDRVEAVRDRVFALRRNGILADRDDEGYLLQIFARTLNDRPTLFYELIERHGATGFGEGNIRALFEALEREQDARGNL